MEGLEGKLDSLGRILIPIKYRQALFLTENTRVKLVLNNNSIIITPVEKVCVICGYKSELDTDFNICKMCLEKIKAT